MISRVIITIDPTAVSQRSWDDFCNARGLVLQPTGYFKAGDGLRAGCQGGRVSFFSRSSDAPVKVARLATRFQIEFGGQVAVVNNLPALVGA
jgi:hypothetical protein